MLQNYCSVRTKPRNRPQSTIKEHYKCPLSTQHTHKAATIRCCSSPLSFTLMPFMKLKRFLTARKAWRLFTAKLQTKLILRRSNKSIKKNRQHLNISTSKPLFWSALSLHSRFKRKRRITKPTHPQRYPLQKRPTPVYINQLFKEPESTLTKECLQPAAKKVDGNNRINRTSRGSTAAAAAADDMWESLALASPQMYGINERAEEFITRFRAQMHSQESLAHHL